MACQYTNLRMPNSCGISDEPLLTDQIFFKPRDPKMPKYSVAVSTILASCFASLSQADELELDWSRAELAFVEKPSETAEILYGLAVYVPSSRLATEDDFNSIIPEFCSASLGNLLEYSSQIENSPEISYLELQFEFYGPTIGESETYIARGASIDLIDGECSF